MSCQRTSELKCKEYKNSTKKSSYLGSLSLISIIYEIDTSNQCSGSQGLIVGGEDAEPAEFPHMAGIGYLDQDKISYLCGGTLISNQHELTAAHCKSYDSIKPTTVRLGSVKINTKNNDAQDFSIASFTSHENYDYATSKNDISVIKLSKVILFTKAIRPACLPQPNGQIPSNATATGWGIKDTFTLDTADNLQKVRLDIIDVRKCQEVYEDDKKIDEDKQICAGVLAGKLFLNCLGIKSTFNLI